MRVALLITTYNRPSALNSVLQSVVRQSRLPDEVVICDDGSAEDTSALIKSWSKRLSISHVWTSDRGFRVALTRNLGILKSKSEILIFVDGDCILPPSFIEIHGKLTRPGYLTSGGRHLLSPEQTQLALEEDLSVSSIFKHWKFWTCSLGPLRDLGSTRWETVRTCNLSAHRENVVRIAGFDESYEGWGREDSDFVVRLMRSGVRIRSGRLAVCVAHMHHLESSREQLSANDERFQAVLDSSDHIVSYSSILKS